MSDHKFRHWLGICIYLHVAKHYLVVFTICYIGLMWPIESYDEWLRFVSRLSPVTYPAEGIRSILLKGVSMFVVCVSVAYVYA